MKNIFLKNSLLGGVNDKSHQAGVKKTLNLTTVIGYIAA
jgi:hypothetical protein